MRVELQLVVCSDAAQEETVANVMAFNKRSSWIPGLILQRCLRIAMHF